ncbi:MAG: cytochrome c oxidase assembly protein [Alphaproteobacteria bacterium]|nr:cytochrome c oxidase assembly protein [Alphaproteobacteria bacterium]
MVGLSYAAVPLYRAFCQLTGLGGTTQRATAAPGVAGERIIRIHFDANVGRSLAWDFKPVQREVSVRIGEETLAFYQAHNPTARTIAGSATFNVTPPQAGIYFRKIQCFCFSEQVLQAGETAAMPVSFFIDPAILHDRNMDDLTSITLSYTFFEQKPETRLSRVGVGPRPSD